MPVTFGLKNHDKVKKIFQVIEELGHQIVDPTVITPEQEAEFSGKEIVDKFVDYLKQADCLVAEASSPSLGVGWEICYMSQVENKPVLCLVEKNKETSIVITDNPSPNVKTEFYNEENLNLILKDFFSTVKPVS